MKTAYVARSVIPSQSANSIHVMKICEAFEITMSHFFLEDSNQSVVLNERQLELLEAASKLDKEQMDALIKFLNKI